MRHVFEKKSRILAPASVLFAWHELPGTLEKLIPPGDPVHVVEHTGGIRDGARVVIRMGYKPFTLRWIARHQNYQAGRQFQDVQEQGPFAFWQHTHLTLPDGPASSILHDHVEYQLPLSPLSEIVYFLVRRKLARTFAYRHEITRQEVEELTKK